MARRRGMQQRLAPVAVVLIGLAGPAAAAVDGTPAQPVTVVAADYHFAPDKLALKQGIAYRLRIENRGKELHQFSAPAFFGVVEIGDPSVLNADRTEIAVEPGDAKELIVVPKKAGRYRLICPDHDWTGMIGEITVE